MRFSNAKWQIVLYGILLLFFLQLLADFVQAIYAFGLLGTSIPIEMISLLFLFSPILLLPFSKRLPQWLLISSGYGVLASRVIEVMLDTRGRMIVSGVGVGCFLVFLPGLLHKKGRERDVAIGPACGAGMAMALALSILLRVLGSGSDLSTHSWSQVIGWVLAAIAGTLLLGLFNPGHKSEVDQDGRSERRLSTWKASALSLGVMSAFVLSYFAFTAPNVIARWTGASYILVISLVVLALGAFVLVLAFAPRLISALNPKLVLAWNGLFTLALVLTILAYQINFPSSPDAYPLPEPTISLLYHVPLVLMLVLWPIIIIDLGLLGQEMAGATPRVFGTSFVLSALFLLIIILGQVFTTVYDYIPVVGPFFRDRFWIVFLIPGAVLTLSMSLVSSKTFQRALSFEKTRVLPATVLLSGLAAIAGTILMAPRPALPVAQASDLKVCTYNIQQGYDANGLENYGGQLALLRQMDADIIGLQESDTNRIAGGNTDIVRYFADRLDMYAYYGPKTVPGTFGIALLSRYPIQDARTFYMYSVGEQTATIEAQIRVGESVFSVFVTHLGNGGPMVQQEAILEQVQDQENVILVGDFNFRPDTAQYGLTTDILDDAWLIKWPQGVDDQDRRFDRRIDHAFVSPGMIVNDAQYFDGPESDHPAFMIEVGL